MANQKTLFQVETESRVTDLDIEEMYEHPLESLELIVRTYYPECDGGIHPACLATPMIDQDSFNELVKDIQKQGLMLPIVRTNDRQLLDGKARLLACFISCQDIRFRDLGTIIDPWDHVWSANFCRVGISSVVRTQFRQCHNFPVKAEDNPFA